MHKSCVLVATMSGTAEHNLSVMPCCFIFTVFWEFTVHPHVKESNFCSRVLKEIKRYQQPLSVANLF